MDKIYREGDKMFLYKSGLDSFLFIKSEATSPINCFPYICPDPFNNPALPALTNPLYPPMPPANPPTNANHGVVFVPYLLSITSPSFCPPYAPANPVAVDVNAGTHPIVPADAIVKGTVVNNPPVFDRD